MTAQYVLVTQQPGATGGEPNNAYGPDPDPASLESAGRLLAGGATPPMTFLVLPLQPPTFGSI